MFEPLSSPMHASAQRSALRVLLLTSTIIWISGNGLIPLLPLYADQLGATSAEIGQFLAISYACLAAGAIIATRWVANPAQAQRTLLITGIATIPLTLAVGQVGSVWELTAVTSVIWFLGGAGFSALNALFGRYVSDRNRGKLMGALAITSPAGSVLGGLISGPIVDRWGFEALFTVLAAINLLWPLANGLFYPRAEALAMHRARSRPSTGTGGRRHKMHWLMLGSTFAYGTYYTLLLASALMMKDAGFSATAISSTAILGGLVAIPFSWGVSSLSDRWGRFPLWVTCHAFGFLGLIVLFFADTLWHFWLAAILTRLISAGGRGISSAWAIDLYHTANVQPAGRSWSQEQLLASLSATIWLGGIFGYWYFGTFSHWFGQQFALLISGAFFALTVLIVLPIQSQRGAA